MTMPSFPPLSPKGMTMPVRHMRRSLTFSLVALALLAGCGADGAPTAPAASNPAVTFSGEARFGVSTP